MSGTKNYVEKLLKLCIESNRLSAEAEHCKRATWVQCPRNERLPKPHEIVPIAVHLGRGRTVTTFGYWTADVDCDKLTSERIVWYTYTGVACGWVLAWCAVPNYSLNNGVQQ